MEAGARGGAHCAAAPALTLDPLLLPLAEDAPTLCCTALQLCAAHCNAVQYSICKVVRCEYGAAVQSVRSGCGDFPP